MSSLAKLSLVAAFALASPLPPAQAQFVRPPTDLISKAGAAGVGIRYKQVSTGTCETRVNVTHLSGYADVRPDSHIHFQFFEARKGDPKKAPLSIWLGGGPGIASVGGLFRENGPCRVNSNGELGDNLHSWNNLSNLLYIDQPVTTGGSYQSLTPGYIDASTSSIVSLPSEDCPEWAANLKCGTYSTFNVSSIPQNTSTAAPDFYKSLQGFIGAFPEYAANGIHIATESYGGHYAPEFGRYIIEQNKQALPGHAHVGLRSVQIGNGWYNPVAGYSSYVSFLQSNAYGISYPNASVYERLKNALEGPGNCLDQLKECYRTDDLVTCKEASSYCEERLGSGSFTKLTGRDSYDIRQISPSPFPTAFHRPYLNQEKIQQALGLYVNYTGSSTIIDRAFRAAADSPREGRSSVEKLGFLLENGVHVALYAGDADFVCNLDVQAATIKTLDPPGYAEAGWTDLKTSDGQLHGQSKQSGTFSFTQFYQSGHEVPFFTPLASLEFFERVINRKDVATGTQDIETGSTYKTVGPTENRVSHGNATVEYKVLDKKRTYNTTTGKANDEVPVASSPQRRMWPLQQLLRRSDSGSQRRSVAISPSRD